MMRRVVKYIFTFMCVLFLVACSNGEEQTNGFPAKPTQGLNEFILTYLKQTDHFLFATDDNDYIFAEENGNDEEKQIDYSSVEEEQLEDYYDSLLGEDDDAGDISRDLFEQSEELGKSTDLDLPDIELDEENKLHVDVEGDEETFSLPSMNASIQKNDSVIFNMTQMNGEGFVIEVKNKDTEKKFDLYVLNDLSAADLFLQDDLDEAIEQKDLEPFYPILQPTDDSKRYLSVSKYLVVDTKNHEAIDINTDHRVSNDGKYIYINGQEEPLEEGEQRIQKLSDYIEGNDHDYATFELDYKAISKDLDFRSTHDVSIGKNMYFSGDYVVLFLNYNAPLFGKAGSTNVLIDLHDKENPVFHLVELGIQNFLDG